MSRATFRLPLSARHARSAGRSGPPLQVPPGATRPATLMFRSAHCRVPATARAPGARTSPANTRIASTTHSAITRPVTRGRTVSVEPDSAARRRGRRRSLRVAQDDVADVGDRRRESARAGRGTLWRCGTMRVRSSSTSGASCTCGPGVRSGTEAQPPARSSAASHRPRAAGPVRRLPRDRPRAAAPRGRLAIDLDAVPARQVADDDAFGRRHELRVPPGQAGVRVTDLALRIAADRERALEEQLALACPSLTMSAPGSRPDPRPTALGDLRREQRMRPSISSSDFADGLPAERHDAKRVRSPSSSTDIARGAAD